MRFLANTVFRPLGAAPALAAAILLSAATAVPAWAAEVDGTVAAHAEHHAIARDRAAILAMQGEYRVSFDFEETVALQSGYRRKPHQRSGGNEVVIVVEDSPSKIVLQHILVSDDGQHVTKHWRQEWIFEATRRFEFSADQTWRVREIPADIARTAWTQCVYEVSDAPRYCGTGRWNHRYGVSTWTSDRSWRPLPRREYTTRSDYNAINAENRHTIVPGGWTHEQDNTKTVRDAVGATVRTLVREFGFNDYRKTTDFDFAPAYRYWRTTAPYWADVRNRWDGLLTNGGLRLKTPVDGMAIVAPLFALASKREAGRDVAARDIDAVFSQWVEPLAAEPTTPTGATAQPDGSGCDRTVAADTEASARDAESSRDGGAIEPKSEADENCRSAASRPNWPNASTNIGTNVSTNVSTNALHAHGHSLWRRVGRSLRPRHAHVRVRTPAGCGHDASTTDARSGFRRLPLRRTLAVRLRQPIR